MKKNMGNLDRSIRGALGAAMIAFSFSYSVWLALIGAVLLFTAALSWCPPYDLLGISTCKRKDS